MSVGNPTVAQALIHFSFLLVCARPRPHCARRQHRASREHGKYRKLKRHIDQAMENRDARVAILIGDDIRNARWTA
jgi:hypothetical protein